MLQIKSSGISVFSITGAGGGGCVTAGAASVVLFCSINERGMPVLRFISSLYVF